MESPKSHSVRPRMSENRSQGVIVSISLKPGRPRSADSIIQDSSCSWSQSGHTGPLKLQSCKLCVSRGMREHTCVLASCDCFWNQSKHTAASVHHMHALLAGLAV